MIKLFIDAGHGGNDPGAVANGMRESDINFEVSKKLAEILRNSDCGFDIMLSRPTTETNPRHPLDNGKSVNARAIMSNEWGADYLISIHTNAAGGTGAELFFWEDTATVRKFSKSVLDTYCKHLALRNRRNEATNRWGVIRLTKCPAILFELAFIDSPAHNPDVNILRYKRDEMAEALAVGICKYFGKKFSLPSQGFD
ncbi:MAG: N-acetylmuramoyl-L-alanine amidase, partial [Defluviitaleaceae bacterium]|nr:N-acetylmuramoyl-L-alanine amidase [Defluviitaleaceae bacterium]